MLGAAGQRHEIGKGFNILAMDLQEFEVAGDL